MPPAKPCSSSDEESSSSSSSPTCSEGKAFLLPLQHLAIPPLILVGLSLALVPFGQASAGSHASRTLLLAQQLWNAGQVTFLAAACGLAAVERQPWVTALLAASTAAVLPFASYVTGRGAVLHAALVLLVSGRLLSCRGLLGLALGGEAKRGALRLGTCEGLAFACNLLSSVYNCHEKPCAATGLFGNGRCNLWPRWELLFDTAGEALALPPAEEVAGLLYNMGLGGPVPAFVPGAAGTGPMTLLVFEAAWAVIPFLYCAYFCVMYADAAKACKAPRQLARGLCAFSVLHFLLLTDLVDYRYGRGFRCRGAELAHFSERLAWRVALLLPLWQKWAEGAWPRLLPGWRGWLLHHGLAAYGLLFFVYMDLIFDVPRFLQLLRGQEPGWVSFGLRYNSYLGYKGALLLMWHLYGLQALLLPGRGIEVFFIEAPS